VSQKKGIFYGWWIILGRILISFGWAASPFSIILKQLMAEFHTGRGMVSILSSVSMVSGAICSYFVARLLENHSARKFMLWGSVMGGIGFLLCAAANSLWQLYVLFFFIGVGFTGIAGSVPLVVLISKWFNKKRGLALGIAWSGYPLAAMIVSPIVGLIAASSGWRATFLFTGLLTLVISIPISLFVIKDTPEEMGLLPDGDTSNGVNNTPAPKITVGDAKSAANKPGLATYFKSLPLWLICIGFSLIPMAEAAVISHEVSFLTDIGISAVLAASALGFTSGMSGIGRWGSGWLADKISPRYVVVLLLGIEIIGILILLQTRTIAMVWLFAAIWGTASGSFFNILPLIIRDIFPSSAFNTVFGFVNSLIIMAMAFSAPLAGFIFDATGSYHLLFILTIVFYIVAIIATYFTYGIRPGHLKSILKVNAAN
jgi:MFS family permease